MDVKRIICYLLILAILAMMFLSSVGHELFSLKGIVAERLVCRSHLKNIQRIIETIAIPERNRDHLDKIVRDLDLWCPEGQRANPSGANYFVIIRDGEYIITESPENHPHYDRWIFGKLSAEQFCVRGQAMEETTKPKQGGIGAE